MKTDLVFFNLQEFSQYCLFEISKNLAKSIAKFKDSHRLSLIFSGTTGLVGDDAIAGAMIQYYDDTKDKPRLHHAIELTLHGDNENQNYLAVGISAADVTFVMMLNARENDWDINIYPYRSSDMEQMSRDEIDDLGKYFLDVISETVNDICKMSFRGAVRE